MKIKHIAGCPVLFGVVLPTFNDDEEGVVNVVPIIPRRGESLDCRDRVSGRWMLLFSHECSILEKYVRFDTGVDVVWPGRAPDAVRDGPYVERPELLDWCSKMGGEVIAHLEERGVL